MRKATVRANLSRISSLSVVTFRAVTAVTAVTAFACIAGLTGLVGCQPREVDVAEGIKGEDCDPTYDAAAKDPESRPCVEGLACESVAGADTFVCASPLRIHGLVVDAITETPLPDALVNGLDRTGAPLGTIAVSDAMGRYELVVSATRIPEGNG